MQGPALSQPPRGRAELAEGCSYRGSCYLLTQGTALAPYQVCCIESSVSIYVAKEQWRGELYMQ